MSDLANDREGVDTMAAPTLEVMLFGTAEPVTAPVLLQAGPLTAELE
jgi:hypothetical protein